MADDDRAGDLDHDELVDPTDDPVTAREAAELDLMEDEDSEEGEVIGDHID